LEEAVHQSLPARRAARRRDLAAGGNRWHVTLIGIAGDYPPTDEEGFLEFARSLPSPALYDAIRDAEPLSKITGFRKSENRVRRFDRMPRFLEGLLVLGDAVFTMNPVYGLGMTAAAVSSSVLNTTLQAQQTADVVEGLAEAFQKKLAKKHRRLVAAGRSQRMALAENRYQR
jgi:2-polyprenyl-6-methoxyphenol hydroxylase-like FAD-dependent oxidoreductase